jgi:hypothetical protein
MPVVLQRVRAGCWPLAFGSVVFYLGLHWDKAAKPNGLVVIFLAIAALALLFWMATSEPVLGTFARHPQMGTRTPTWVSISLPRATHNALGVWSIPFYNRQDAGGERATANGVVATIEAFRQGERTPVVGPTHGRWGPLGEADDYQRDCRPADFPPTHEERLLNVIAQAIGPRGNAGEANFSTLINAASDLHRQWLVGGSNLGNDTEYELTITLRGGNLGGGLRRLPRFRYRLIPHENGSLWLEPAESRLRRFFKRGQP